MHSLTQDLDLDQDLLSSDVHFLYTTRSKVFAVNTVENLRHGYYGVVIFD